MKLRNASRVALTALSLSALLVACGEDAPENNNNNNNNSNNNNNNQTAKVKSNTAGGMTSTEVDGADKLAWVYLSFAQGGKEVTPADPKSSSDWDIAIRRSNIKLNGGFSGSGMVEIQAVAAKELSEVTAIPGGEYITDKKKAGMGDPSMGQVDDDGTDFAFARANSISQTGWFNYDTTNHVLSPAEIVWVIKTGTKTYKLKILDYYNQAGTAGHLSFNWAELMGESFDGLVVNAADPKLWVYVDAAQKTVIASQKEAPQARWDFAVQGLGMKTNGGATNPMGLGGARWAAEGVAYDAIDTCGTVGFEIDKEIPVPGPPGSGTFVANPVLTEWWNYDSATHQVSPKDRSFLIRGVDGQCFKMKLVRYEGSKFYIHLDALTTKAEVQAQMLDASAQDKWVYLSLRTGQMIEVETASTSLEWDLSFQRTVIRTNSGTSGSGMAGTINTMQTDLDMVAQAMTAGYEADTMLMSPRPGGMDYSGNGPLATWYNYNGMTHSLETKGEVYLVRTADGNYAKFQIRGYAEGVLDIAWVYAGPGKSEF